MRWFTEQQWAMVEDKSDLTPEEIPIFYAAKEKLDALRGAYFDLERNLDGYLIKALKKIEAAKREIRLCKAKHDAVLEELGTTHNMPNRQQMLSVCAAWQPWWDAPDYFYDSETGLRLEIKPGPTHEWHSEWKQRLLECRTCYGPAGPPPYPPFNRSAAWETRSATRDHPFPLYWEPDSQQKLAWERQQNEEKSDGEEGQLREEHVEKGADLDLESEPEEAGPSDIMKALGHLEHYANDQPTTGRNRPRALPSAAPTEQSGSTTRPSKRDKGKGKAVDTPSIPNKSSAAPIANTTSISAGLSRSAASTPIAASKRPIASTSAAATKNISRAASSNTTSAAVTKGNTNQETRTGDVDDNTNPVRPRALRIKIKTAAERRDIKGKGKAVDEPSTTTNNNQHKILKPGSSKHPAAIATHQTIKRSQVVKGKYWVSRKLDSSLFTKTGSIRADFAFGKSNTHNGVKEKGHEIVHGTAKDRGKGNGEGRSGMASSSKNDFDSGSETDNSKDSDYTLKSKPRKRKATAAATAATTTTITTTTASSSHSSSNKRKRTTTETGDDDEEDTYYVLRCPLDRNCMTESSYTHDTPASIRGVFCEHPFKKRRAMEHFRECGLQGQISSERRIWEECCLKVVPDRKNTPVNAEWAEKHNRTLIRSAVKQTEGGKKEKERVEKEMEEEL